MQYYRGGNEGHWITPDKSFATEYGTVSGYKIPENLNLLDATTTEGDEFVSRFMNESIEDALSTTDFWYQPTKDFIVFLKKEGYDGFTNDKNIFIADRANLSIFREVVNL